jgi:hypothetical protein
MGAGTGWLTAENGTCSFADNVYGTNGRSSSLTGFPVGCAMPPAGAVPGDVATGRHEGAMFQAQCRRCRIAPRRRLLAQGALR